LNRSELISLSVVNSVTYCKLTFINLDKTLQKFEARFYEFIAFGYSAGKILK